MAVKIICCDISFHSTFLAAHPPIETWSSLPADVLCVSAEAGKHSVLFSETRAADVQWGIMNPEFTPEDMNVRNG